MSCITIFSRLQKIGNIHFRGNCVRKHIALTFDDGPSEQTNEILDILNQYGVRGTFFVLGKKLTEKSALVTRIAKQGSEIGNHSYSHANLTRLSYKNICSELTHTDQKLGEYGITTRLFRPPYGATNLRVVCAALKLQKKIILWDVDPQDWRCNYDAQERASYIINNIRSGSIIDLHEYAENIGKNKCLPKILHALIPTLQSNKYTLATVSEVIGFEKHKSIVNACRNILSLDRG